MKNVKRKRERKFRKQKPSLWPDILLVSKSKQLTKTSGLQPIVIGKSREVVRAWWAGREVIHAILYADISPLTCTTGVK
jgi:hypothetical protein